MYQMALPQKGFCFGVVRMWFGCCSQNGVFCEQHPNKGVTLADYTIGQSIKKADGNETRKPTTSIEVVGYKTEWIKILKDELVNLVFSQPGIAAKLLNGDKIGFFFLQGLADFVEKAYTLSVTESCYQRHIFWEDADSFGCCFHFWDWFGWLIVLKPGG